MAMPSLARPIFDFGVISFCLPIVAIGPVLAIVFSGDTTRITLSRLVGVLHHPGRGDDRPAQRGCRDARPRARPWRNDLDATDKGAPAGRPAEPVRRLAHRGPFGGSGVPSWASSSVCRTGLGRAADQFPAGSELQPGLGPSSWSQRSSQAPSMRQQAWSLISSRRGLAKSRSISPRASGARRRRAEAASWSRWPAGSGSAIVSVLAILLAWSALLQVLARFVVHRQGTARCLGISHRSQCGRRESREPRRRHADLGPRCCPRLVGGSRRRRSHGPRLHGLADPATHPLRTVPRTAIDAAHCRDAADRPRLRTRPHRNRGDRRHRRLFSDSGERRASPWPGHRSNRSTSRGSMAARAWRRCSRSGCLWHCPALFGSLRIAAPLAMTGAMLAEWLANRAEASARRDPAGDGPVRL